jgi:cyclohexanone monooxygenase
VERIDETGVWVGGEHYELDCLIFASGFEVGNEHSRKSGLRVEGRDGRDLVEYWADGMRTLHGVHVHNFPNLFVVGVAQGANLVSNIPHNFVETAATIASVVAHAREHDVAVVEATAAAEDEWVTLMETAGRSFFGDASCTPGFYNNEGAPMGRREHLNSCGYPAGAMAYFEFMEQWRTSGAFAGLTMHAR